MESARTGTSYILEDLTIATRFLGGVFQASKTARRICAAGGVPVQRHKAFTLSTGLGCLAEDRFTGYGLGTVVYMTT